ncbi:transposase [Neisseria sicca]|uniref:Transposase n=1 Tax=Neisseria sicca TaxID=490 RepID=A0A2I1XC27_NEISI|nr:transposase [Neisseria sicca]
MFKGASILPFFLRVRSLFYSGLNLNQDKATKPQTVQIVRQGEATPYWFKVNPL